MTSSNYTRAERCAAAILGYGDDLVESNLIDLMADAMHWCDSSGRHFHIVLAQACRHYIHELTDDQRDERRMIP